MAGDHLGGGAALVPRLVGEHRLADDVADRVDVRDVGAPLLVDGDHAALVDLDAAGLEVEQVAVGAAADGDEDEVVGLRLGSVVALELDLEPVVVRLDPGDLRREHDRLVAALDPLRERLDEVAVAAGDQVGRQLDDADLAAERVVDGRHLEADDPAADDQHPLGDLRQLERAGRVDDPRVVGQAREHRRPRAGRDDAVVELDRLVRRPRARSGP